MTDFAFTYTRICAKVRRHLPARRMRPMELHDIAHEIHVLLSVHLSQGETYSAAHDKIVLGMIITLKGPACEAIVSTGSRND